MSVKALLKLWNPKEAVKIMEGIASTRTPTKSIMFPRGGVPVNSYELPANYITESIENVPMVYASNQPEPVAVTSMNPVNFDIGSFFVVKNYTKRESDQMVQLLNSSKQGEMTRLMTRMTANRDRYNENLIASGLTGKSIAQTRDSNGQLVDFEITFGTVGTTAYTGTSFATATLAEMLEAAELLKEGVQANFGDIDIPNDELVVFCARNVFTKIYAKRNAKQKIDVIEVETGRLEGFRYMEVDGFKFVDIAGKYRLPDGTSANAVADDYMQMVWQNESLGHGFYYLAIDNFAVDMPFKALPMVSYMMEGNHNKSVSHYFESRPIVIYNTKAMEKMKVIS